MRGFLAQRLYQNLRVRHMAATLIQKMWRGYEVRLWYTNLRRSLVHFQVRAGGGRDAAAAFGGGARSLGALVAESILRCGV